MKKLTCILISILVIQSCVIDETPIEYGTLEIRITDVPTSFEKISIEVNQVKLYHVDGSNKGTWIILDDLQQNEFNLLEYKNGKSIELATTKIAPGTLSEIVLVLGNNYIETSEGIFKLNLSSSQHPEIEVDIEQDLTYENDVVLYLDFVLNKSIKSSNGVYYFEPVIRAFSYNSTGELEGYIHPAEANSKVVIGNATVSLETQPESDGYFCFLGLAEGQYNLSFLPEAPYIENTIENTSILIGEKINIGHIQLEKKTFEYVSGDLNINPSISQLERFEMQTPQGLIDIDKIYAEGDVYTYAGPATEIRVMPKAQGDKITIDGVEVALRKDQRYTISSVDSQMKAHLRNVKNGNGHWWIEISAANVIITPHLETAN